MRPIPLLWVWFAHLLLLITPIIRSRSDRKVHSRDREIVRRHAMD